jgi:hypothetical protein
VGLVGITCVNDGLDCCTELMLGNTFTISIIYAILLHLADLNLVQPAMYQMIAVCRKNASSLVSLQSSQLEQTGLY